MRIRAVRIENFRSILSEEVPFDRLTVLVGPNGAGKSAVLRAIEVFYDPKPSLAQEDFYNHDDSQPVRIAVTFTDLTPAESKLFQPYLQGNDLTVTKAITLAGERYHGTRLQHAAFATTRQADGRQPKRTAYNELRQNAPYNDLPPAKNADEVDAALGAWEERYPEQCQPMLDDGQFFGFRNVGQARLERHTRFVLIPAVREADQDALDTKGSAIFQLMELVVRSTLARTQQFVGFRDSFQAQYRALVDPGKLTQLGELESQLTAHLTTYVPSAKVILTWQPGDDLEIPLPKAMVRLHEDGFTAPVDRVGHGLQRAFIMSLLQSLAGAPLESPAPATPPPPDPVPAGAAPVASQAQTLPSLILAIEEPELFQHPNRQRHIARILAQLADGRIRGVADRTQVLYCTHSPLFVDLPVFDSVRRLTKAPNQQDAAKPKVTRVAHTTLQSLAKRLEEIQPTPPTIPFTGDSVRARMITLMTPWMNEGFFADVVVLVEGEDDRAAILGAAKRMNVDLEALGVAVVPCGGKASLDRPYLVFSGLGIPAYVVYDGDSKCRKDEQGSTVRSNRLLQKLLNVAEPSDFPATHVCERYAVFESDLDTFIRDAVQEKTYTDVVLEFRNLGYAKPDQCKKSPLFVARVLEEGAKVGRTVAELEQIVKVVRALLPQPPADSARRIEPGVSGDAAS